MGSVMTSLPSEMLIESKGCGRRSGKGWGSERFPKRLCFRGGKKTTSPGFSSISPGTTRPLLLLTKCL